MIKAYSFRSGGILQFLYAPASLNSNTVHFYGGKRCQIFKMVYLECRLVSLQEDLQSANHNSPVHLWEVFLRILRYTASSGMLLCAFNVLKKLSRRLILEGIYSARLTQNISWLV